MGSPLNPWRKWRGLHPVQRWALRITALVVFLHVAPVWPYIPGCLDEASIFQPPRLRPESLAETSATMSSTWLLHIVFAGRIWVTPAHTIDIESWWSWGAPNMGHLIARRIASGVMADGTRFEPPAAVIQALAARRQEARETRRAGKAALWDESMEYWDCAVQRAAFLPD